jgi:hypothetical protein
MRTFAFLRIKKREVGLELRVMGSKMNGLSSEGFTKEGLRTVVWLGRLPIL